MFLKLTLSPIKVAADLSEFWLCYLLLTIAKVRYLSILHALMLPFNCRSSPGGRKKPDMHRA